MVKLGFEIGTAVVGLLIAEPTLAVDRLPSSEVAPSIALSWDQEARALILAGQVDAASAIIEARLAIAPKDLQARFLAGMIAAARGQNRKAIALYRSILVDEPGASRVRLELARTFFLEKDFGNALRQFQFALAADPPASVADNIRKYIAAIREAKTLSYTVSVAVAPDTNLNTGSAAREVTLFGLPFDLSDEARQRSGVGLAVEGGGEWAPTIAPRARLRIGANLHRREYVGSTFDDMIIAGYMGPRLVTGKWDLSLLATGYRRWFGGLFNSHAEGLRLEASYYVDGQLGLSAAATAQRVRYTADCSRDGSIVSLGGGAYYAVTPTSALNLKAGVSRQRARDEAYSSWSAFVAPGYVRELPLGFTAYLEPSFSLAEYDAPLLAFGRRRSDRTYSILASLLNRRLVLGHFTPRVSYTYTRQNSSVPLYQFNRNRVEIGLTTVF